MLYLKDTQMSYLKYEVSILLNFSDSEAFAGDVLVFGEISYFILFSLNWTSDLISHLTLKHLFSLRIPRGANIPDWLTNHKSFRILLPLFDWSANSMR